MFERQYFPINEEMAKTAHNMMSMRDYQEGSKTAEYKGYADKVYDLAEQIAENDPSKQPELGRLPRLMPGVWRIILMQAVV